MKAVLGPGDQITSNIVWWPNMLMLKWVAKRLKHVWSNSDQTPKAKNYGLRIRKQHVDTRSSASVVRMRAANRFDTAVQTNKTSPIKHENKRNVLSLIECLMTFKFYQTRSNSTKPGGRTVKYLVTQQQHLVAKHFPFGQALSWKPTFDIQHEMCHFTNF